MNYNEALCGGLSTSCCSDKVSFNVVLEYRAFVSPQPVL